MSGLNEIPAQKLEKDSHPAAHFRSDSELASKAVDQHSSAITSSTKHLEQLSLKDLREVTPDPTQSTARVQKRRLSLFEPFSLPSSRVSDIF